MVAEASSPLVPQSRELRQAGLVLAAAFVLGGVGEVITYRGGDVSQAYLVTESFFARFAGFLVVVLCGRSAPGPRQATAAGLILALGAYAGGAAADLLGGWPVAFGPFGLGAGDFGPGLSAALILPPVGVLLAFLTRRVDFRGDLALAVLLQAQLIPAVSSLLYLFSREGGECCVAVEWGHPWQDWAGLALALSLTVLLRPTPAARLRSFAAMAVLAASLIGVGRLQGFL
ncbi:hypothetical protein [Planotetraspora mira]|uniref:Uncharacterized protein n=1 Tax=Planotetraspora mira TaxID=58121 RepID=A0A8J3TWF8_9ACTN|nr:hypothetical protein [Planotetraspora mira]GII33301.1 hypothetical protein Pmi06nite_67430 [Planotetraspora mira]